MGEATRPGEPATQHVQQYLTFLLGQESFAIGILAIKEIIEYPQVTRVPMMPTYLRGVINLRGAVVPVVDLQVRFGRPASPVARKTCIVIIEIRAGETQSQDIGIVVDCVDSVIDIAAADTEPPPAFGTGITVDFIRGMGKVNGRFVILLEVNSLLAVQEMDLLRQTAQSSEAAA